MARLSGALVNTLILGAVYIAALLIVWRTGLPRARLENWRIGTRPASAEKGGRVLVQLEGEGLPPYRLSLEPELAHTLSDQLLQAAAHAADRDQHGDETESDHGDG